MAEYGGTASSTGLQFLTTDHLGSTRLVTDAVGQQVSTNDYLPFGEEIGGSGCGTLPGSVKFTGQYRDQESCLDDFKARMMSSAQGRFTSPDPSGLLTAKPTNPQNWNLYGYTINSPLIGIDTTGLDCVYANEAGNSLRSIDHDGNSDVCGSDGGPGCLAM